MTGYPVVNRSTFPFMEMPPKTKVSSLVIPVPNQVEDKLRRESGEI